MRHVSRQELLIMAQTIIEQPEFKIPESHTDQHPLTAVSCVVLMSYVMIQLIEFRSQGKVPNNLSSEEQKITEFLLKKSQFPAHAPYLRVFLQKIRAQLNQFTQTFHRERVREDYPAKNKLIELYGYLLRDSLMLHPTCPFFSAKKDVIFGGTGIGSAGLMNLSSLDGINGFKLDGEHNGDFVLTDTSYFISAIGDINADQHDDLVIGVYGYLQGNAQGRSYVVFGSPGVGSAGLFISTTPLLG